MFSWDLTQAVKTFFQKCSLELIEMQIWLGGLRVQCKTHYYRHGKAKENTRISSVIMQMPVHSHAVTSADRRFCLKIYLTIPLNQQ